MTGRTERRRVLRVRVADADPAAGHPGGGAPAVGAVAAAGAVAAKGSPGEPRADLLAVEEPLEIRVNGAALTVTMRTPGDDLDLAAGFLVTEGVVGSPGAIASIRMCAENVADVTLADPAAGPGAAARRNFLTSSACGVCGKESIDTIRVMTSYDVAGDGVAVRAATLSLLPGRLREAQRVFASTGGLHAAGIFTAEGTLIALREDVGRHNAVDKVVGWALRAQRLPLAGCVLLVSGRASFELVQKALMAGIPVLAAVSAPSSLAAGLAEEGGMTLIGFLRGDSMNVYTGAHRLTG